MIKAFNEWYDALKEPYRFLVAMTILHPLWFMETFPLYSGIGLLIIAPIILYRAFNYGREK